MDCSLRKASRKEQSIAPNKCIFWTHQDQKKAKIPYIRVHHRHHSVYHPNTDEDHGPV